MNNRAKCPVYLDLRRIRLPVTALVSFGHRVSGVVLFLLLAPALYVLGRALEGPEGFAVAAGWLAGPAGRVALVLLAWSLAHHLFAGLRSLLLDLHLGVSLSRARQSALGVIVLGLAVLVSAAVLVW